jgi:hypothetical protein
MWSGLFYVVFVRQGSQPSGLSWWVSHSQAAILATATRPNTHQGTLTFLWLAVTGLLGPVLTACARWPVLSVPTVELVLPCPTCMVTGPVSLSLWTASGEMPAATSVESTLASIAGA